MSQLYLIRKLFISLGVNLTYKELVNLYLAIKISKRLKQNQVSQNIESAKNQIIQECVEHGFSQGLQQGYVHTRQESLAVLQNAAEYAMRVRRGSQAIGDFNSVRTMDGYQLAITEIRRQQIERLNALLLARNNEVIQNISTECQGLHSARELTSLHLSQVESPQFAIGGQTSFDLHPFLGKNLGQLAKAAHLRVTVSAFKEIKKESLLDIRRGFETQVSVSVGRPFVNLSTPGYTFEAGASCTNNDPSLYVNLLKEISISPASSSLKQNKQSQSSSSGQTRRKRQATFAQTETGSNQQSSTLDQSLGKETPKHQFGQNRTPENHQLLKDTIPNGKKKTEFGQIVTYDTKTSDGLNENVGYETRKAEIQRGESQDYMARYENRFQSDGREFEREVYQAIPEPGQILNVNRNQTPFRSFSLVAFWVLGGLLATFLVTKVINWFRKSH